MNTVNTRAMLCAGLSRPSSASAVSTLLWKCSTSSNSKHILSSYLPGRNPPLIGGSSPQAFMYACQFRAGVYIYVFVKNINFNFKFVVVEV